MSRRFSLALVSLFLLSISAFAAPAEKADRVEKRPLQIGTVTMISAPSSPRAAKVIGAMRRAETAQASAHERWTATQPIMFDAATNQLRKPTAAETAAIVRSLRVLTFGHGQMNPTTQADGTRIARAEGGFAQIVVARAKEDGTMETRCVASFDEAVDFLGFVAESTNGATE
jgi:hypothetical protein